MRQTRVRVRLSAAALLTSALVGNVLAGCSSNSVPIVRPTTSATSVPRPTTTALVVPAGTVVATGQFQGRASGHVQVVSNGDGDYTVELRNLQSKVTAHTRVALARDSRVFNCADVDGMNLDLGGLYRSATQDLVLHKGYAPHADSDPSFLKSLAIKNDTDQLPLPDCVHHTFATARLTWTMPDMRPTLHVLDHAAAPGAEGRVVARAGTPVSYEVTADDTLAAIAKRFNVSVDDLFYLNPQRSRGESRTAYIGETLNLDRSSR